MIELADRQGRVGEADEGLVDDQSYDKSGTGDDMQELARTTSRQLE